jgi:hypothetical protein
MSRIHGFVNCLRLSRCVAASSSAPSNASRLVSAELVRPACRATSFRPMSIPTNARRLPRLHSCRHRFRHCRRSRAAVASAVVWVALAACSAALAADLRAAFWAASLVAVDHHRVMCRFRPQLRRRAVAPAVAAKAARQALPEGRPAASISSSTIRPRPLPRRVRSSLRPVRFPPQPGG